MFTVSSLLGIPIRTILGILDFKRMMKTAFVCTGFCLYSRYIIYQIKIHQIEIINE